MGNLPPATREEAKRIVDPLSGSSIRWSRRSQCHLQKHNRRSANRRAEQRLAERRRDLVEHLRPRAQFFAAELVRGGGAGLEVGVDIFGLGVEAGRRMARNSPSTAALAVWVSVLTLLLGSYPDSRLPDIWLEEVGRVPLETSPRCVSGAHFFAPYLRKSPVKSRYMLSPLLASVGLAPRGPRFGSAPASRRSRATAMF